MIRIPFVLCVLLGTAFPVPPQEAPGQDPPDAPAGDVTREFKATIWDQQTLVADLSAVEASITDRSTMTGALRRGTVVYYTKPATPDEVSQKIRMNFGAGQVDGRTITFDLHTGVTIAMENGTKIETPDLRVEYPTRTLRTEGPVRITDPEVALTGIGFEGDDTLKQITILSSGALQITGRPADLKQPGPRPPRGPNSILTRLSCAGPLSIRDLGTEMPGPHRYMRLSATDNVVLEREEAGRRTQTTAKSALIYLIHLRTGGVEPLSVALRGAIETTDSDGAKMRAEKLDWESRDDLLRLSGAPEVVLLRQGQSVMARQAVIDRWAGRAVFTGNPHALVSPAGEGSALNLSAQELEMLLTTVGGRQQASSLRASGDVALEGELDPSAGPIVARGSVFTWNILENQGSLQGSPFARIDRGRSLVQSPEIFFEGRTMFVLKGPKRLHFVHQPKPKPGEAAQAPIVLRASCRGDVVYDAGQRLVTLADDCVVSTPDMRMEARRLHLRLSAEGDDLEALRGFGGVKIDRQGLRLSGDSLLYEPDRDMIEVRGEPYAVASMKGLESRNGILRLDQATGRIEFEGGRYGGRIDLSR